MAEQRSLAEIQTDMKDELLALGGKIVAGNDANVLRASTKRLSELVEELGKFEELVRRKEQPE